MTRPSEEAEVIQPIEPRGGVEALRPYIGKVIAFEPGGEVRASADTWEELMKKLSQEMLAALVLTYIPARRVIA